MVGGGALFFDVLSKYHFEQLYISDINPELINAYTAIKENVEPLITRLEEMQAAFLPLGGSGRKQYFYQIRDRFNATVLNQKTSVEKAACFIFLNKTCFNGLYRVNRKGLFNVPMGDYKNPAICDAEKCDDCLRRLHHGKSLYRQPDLCLFRSPLPPAFGNFRVYVVYQRCVRRRTANPPRAVYRRNQCNGRKNCAEQLRSQKRQPGR